jgi:hypothetical protein
MKKIILIFLSLIVLASAGIGTTVAANDTNNTTDAIANDTANDPAVNNTVANNTAALAAPTANAIVADSGNSVNVNRNTVIVKSTNVNTQIQSQRALRQGTNAVVVYYVPMKIVVIPMATSGTMTTGNGLGTSSNNNGTSVPLQTTGLNPISGIVGILGVVGGLLVSRLKFGS